MFLQWTEYQFLARYGRSCVLYARVRTQMFNDAVNCYGYVSHKAQRTRPHGPEHFGCVPDRNARSRTHPDSQHLRFSLTSTMTQLLFNTAK